MKPGETKGSVVLEDCDEIETAIGSLDARARDVDDDTARDIGLVTELLDDGNSSIEIGVDPSKLILSALECARFDTRFRGGEAMRQHAAEMYEEYRKQAIGLGHWLSAHFYFFYRKCESLSFIKHA